MKKHFIALLLALCFICACSVSAFASDDFNVDIIKDAQDIYFMEDEMEGNTIFTLASLITSNPDVFDFGDTAIIFYPCIIVYDDLDVEFFAFEAIIFSFQPVNFNELIFKIGDTRYNFTNILYKDFSPSQNIFPFQNQLGVHMTIMAILLDSRSLSMVDNWVQNRDTPVKIRFKVDDFKHYDMTMSSKIMDGTVHLYNLFAQAGGLSESALSKMEQFYQSSPSVFPIFEAKN